jgi:hypothetical protein
MISWVLDLAISVTAPDLGANSGLVYSLVSLFEQCPKEFILLGRVRNPRGLSIKGSCAQPPLPPTQPRPRNRYFVPVALNIALRHALPSPFTPWLCSAVPPERRKRKMWRGRTVALECCNLIYKYQSYHMCDIDQFGQLIDDSPPNY